MISAHSRMPSRGGSTSGHKTSCLTMYLASADTSVRGSNERSGLVSLVISSMGVIGVVWGCERSKTPRLGVLEVKRLPIIDSHFKRSVRVEPDSDALDHTAHLLSAEEGSRGYPWAFPFLGDTEFWVSLGHCRPLSLPPRNIGLPFLQNKTS